MTSLIDVLVHEVDNHPHREEILSLMHEQIADDKNHVCYQHIA